MLSYLGRGRNETRRANPAEVHLGNRLTGQGWRCPKAQCALFALANLRSLQMSTNSN